MTSWARESFALVPGGNGYWIDLHGPELDGEAKEDGGEIVEDAVGENPIEEASDDDGDTEGVYFGEGLGEACWENVPVTVLLRAVRDAREEILVQLAVGASYPKVLPALNLLPLRPIDQPSEL